MDNYKPKNATRTKPEIEEQQNILQLVMAGPTPKPKKPFISHRIIAMGPAFKNREFLKKIGFHWDLFKKVWYVEVPSSANMNKMLNALTKRCQKKCSDLYLVVFKK